MILVGREDQDVIAWLSPLSFWAKQNDIFSRRKSGTGEWILKAELFEAWLAGGEEVLWCPGIRELFPPFSNLLK
jgi:hypothetical protein